jgi:hypothetical protein
MQPHAPAVSAAQGPRNNALMTAAEVPHMRNMLPHTQHHDSGTGAALLPKSENRVAVLGFESFFASCCSCDQSIGRFKRHMKSRPGMRQPVQQVADHHLAQLFGLLLGCTVCRPAAHPPTHPPTQSTMGCVAEVA